MDELIFDRTTDDLLNLTSKAYYNYNDLNRIESWCEYLTEILNSYSYPVSIITKTDWTMYDFPKASEMERIRLNIKALKTVYTSFSEVPDNVEKMTIEKANDIERVLHDIDYLLRHMENNFIYCGVASCGQNRIWQQRFRRTYTYLILKTWEELTQETWEDFDDNDTWKGVGEVATDHEL